MVFDNLLVSSLANTNSVSLNHHELPIVIYRGVEDLEISLLHVTMSISVVIVWVLCRQPYSYHTLGVASLSFVGSNLTARLLHSSSPMLPEAYVQELCCRWSHWELGSPPSLDLCILTS